MIPLVLILALIQKESSGNDRAVNYKEHAYGCLQIGNGVRADFNKATGRNVKPVDCYDRALSIEIFTWYVGNYAIYARLGRNPTWEDYARIWNGGPNGFKKPETKTYWHKVQQKFPPGIVDPTR